MKKILALGLVAVFLAVTSGVALADGNSPARKGKKCSGHHCHKKGSKAGTSSDANSPNK
jgi:hypothetical protein